jgi:hypothetical protein
VLTEEQRARWVALAGLAADEAGLPTDPEFRAAFVSCLEWASRAGGGISPASGLHRPGTPAPRWAWTAAGPPSPAAAADDSQDGGQAPVPGPGEDVSFAGHIKPLFRERDRQSMSFAFDLWSCDDVRAQAAGILTRLRDGSMPCDGAWPQDRIGVFQRWVDSGMLP